MRIAIVAPPWLPVPPPAYGGTEVVIDALARGLVAAGHDVLLFATGDSTCDVPLRWVLPEAAGTVGTGAATELRHVINAYGDIADWGADVVHDHTLVGPVYGQRFGIPIVTTNHGPFEGELAALYRAIAHDVEVVALSDHHAATARDIPIGAVICHGVDVGSFPLGSGDGGHLLFLGRMSPDKGVHTAASIARAAGIPLLIAAKMREPAEVAYFEATVAPLLGDGVEYVGEVGRRDKLDLLASARALLNPIAWAEPFGMVMLESLACGTPVLATPHGSAPEIVDDGLTGFLREASALEAVIDRVDELDRHDCRTVASQRFSTERMVADHVRAYARAVEVHARRPRHHEMPVSSLRLTPRSWSPA